ncbi:MAG: hypothetical protein K6E61_03435 [Bacteroidales bacterium]|nr:hypothetical protein [Bacteroidales bacterium]
MVQGYNVALKINDLTILGRTQDDLTIAANIKESQTKDDAGSKQYSVVGQEVSFKCSALIDVSGDTASAMDRDSLIALALEVGENAEFDVTYEADDGDAYEGTGIITNYTESSNASDDATLSVDIKITGDFTKVIANQ